MTNTLLTAKISRRESFKWTKQANEDKNKKQNKNFHVERRGKNIKKVRDNGNQDLA